MGSLKKVRAKKEETHQARSRVSFPTVCFRNDTTPPPLDYSKNSRGQAFSLTALATTTGAIAMPVALCFWCGLFVAGDLLRPPSC